MAQADFVYLLFLQEQCPCPTGAYPIRFLLLGAAAQPNLVHAQTQLSHGSAGLRPSPSHCISTLALTSTNGCQSVAKSCALETQSTFTPRETSAMSSPAHCPHLGFCAYQWEPHPSQCALLVPQPGLFPATDFVHAYEDWFSTEVSPYTTSQIMPPKT